MAVLSVHILETKWRQHEGHDESIWDDLQWLAKDGVDAACDFLWNHGFIGDPRSAHEHPFCQYLHSLGYQGVYCNGRVIVQGSDVIDLPDVLVEMHRQLLQELR